jgi:hypothetical protein
VARVEIGGPSVAVGSVGWQATALDRQAWATPLSLNMGGQWGAGDAAGRG